MAMPVRFRCPPLYMKKYESKDFKKLNRKLKWSCKYCSSMFRTRADMYSHIHTEHSDMCDGKLHGIVSKSWKEKNKEKYKESCLKQRLTVKERLKNGDIVPAYTGRHHSEDDRLKKSIKCRESFLNKVKVKGNYNKKSIKIIESIALEHNWHFQHAENGGEKKISNYFVDAFDEKNKVILEYDENRHYYDIDKKILKKKDIIRQNIIMRTMKGYSFYRYIEKTGELYQVFPISDSELESLIPLKNGTYTL